MNPPPLHADIAHLDWLLGPWAGSGEGHYPTIEPFAYNEQVEFGHVGKPFISYTQRTKHAETGLPLHAEVGYFRPVGVDAVELVLVQPSGIVEIHAGAVVGTKIDLAATSVQTTPTAKDVTEVRRTITVTDDVLTYDIHMAAVGLEMQHHLTATLRRV